MSERIHNWLDHWIFRAYRVDMRALAAVRIIFASYLLTFLARPFHSLADMPVSFFDPPPGLPQLWSGWPPREFLVGLEIALLLAWGLLLIGYRTKWVSLALTGLMLLFFSVWHGFGKIDHVILMVVFPAIMAGSGWGQRWSVDERRADPPKEPEAWPLALLALVTGFLWMTAGYYKVRSGWLDPHTQAAQANIVANALVNDRPLVVGSAWITEAHSGFWETIDWLTVAFELLFLPAVLMVRVFRLWIIGALAFHLSAQLLMGVDFSLYALVYLPFFAWPPRRAASAPLRSWIARIPRGAWIGLLPGLLVGMVAGGNILRELGGAFFDHYRASLAIALALLMAIGMWLRNTFRSQRGAALAIVSPNRYKYSETFIHAHCRHLPFEKYILYGGYFPTHATQNIEGSEEVEIGHGGEERGLGKWFRKHSVGVVLAEYGPTGVAVMEACRAAQLPLVVHFHGYDAYRADVLGDQGRRYPELFVRASALVVVSRDMHHQLLRLGAPEEKIRHLPYGVPVDHFVPVVPSQNPPVCVAVGRFTAKKAPLQLLGAFRLVCAERPEARLVILGDGELWEAAREMWAGDPVLRRAVRMPGRASPEEVKAALRGARMFVQASRVPESGDSEGLPLAVLEAMATGLPVVATQHAGIPEAVTHGQEGWLSPANAPEQLADNIIKVLDAPERGDRMGKCARQRIEQDFSQERYHSALAELLRESQF